MAQSSIYTGARLLQYPFVGEYRSILGVIYGSIQAVLQGQAEQVEYRWPVAQGKDMYLPMAISVDSAFLTVLPVSITSKYFQ